MSNRHRTADKRYIDHGDGDNVIILIHGFLSSSRYWNRMRPNLVKAGYRVISIDLLGFGRAEKPSCIEYGYNDQTEYIRQIICDLKLTKSYNLVGHSMGAIIATRYAKLFGKDVKSLVLLHPPLYLNSIEASETLLKTGKLYRFLLLSRYRAVGWKLLRYTIPYIISSHTSTSREQSLNNIVLKAELISDLKDITTKTLLLIGQKDRAIYLDNLLNVKWSPLVQVVKADVDHHSPIKYPLLVQAYILNFINKSSKLVH